MTRPAGRVWPGRHLQHHVHRQLGAGAVQVEPGVDDLVHQVKRLEAAVVGGVGRALVLLRVCPETEEGVTYSSLEAEVHGRHPGIEGEGGMVTPGIKQPDIVLNRCVSGVLSLGQPGDEEVMVGHGGVVGGRHRP